ncbi:hypothetical protein B0H15DRAFT_910380 [Mycena belliarum]|uniref:Rhodanese domain-containing protein n=1 Tax=Mycena belliarum TaxID=1033014 RepID=A0AAD6XKR7_9AGAR|nr:hypothetical protein B0H15DRAFT_910380 [Mycena belliae]
MSHRLSHRLSTTLSSLGSTSGLRTLDDVRDQVATELAMRAASTAETVDGVRLGVVLTLASADDERFLRLLAESLRDRLLHTSHLFALATTGAEAHLLFTGSSPAQVQRALSVAAATLTGRMGASSTAADERSAQAAVEGVSLMDEPLLWRVLRASLVLARDERTPPPGALGVAQMLAGARRGVRRLTPGEAFDAVQGLGDPALLSGGPTFLVDIRPAPRRGGITGSLVVDRNDLEWAFDPRLAHLLIASSYALRPILICADGRASSLAAAALRALGLYNATDVVGGFRAWREAGLDVAGGDSTAEEEY